MPERKNMLKELKIFAAAVVIGLGIALGLAAQTYVYSETTQADIAQHVIRFHVLAHSDAQDDQWLKNQVREGVLEAFKDGLNASSSVAETRRYLAAHLEEIRACAQAIVWENGYEYPVSATVAWDFFPTKAYGDVVFPPGNYEALRIVIGSGEGRNWWCVMFPPLCYVDLTQDTLSEDGKQQLLRALPKDEYTLLAHAGEDLPVHIRFKIVEWWQNRKKPPQDDEKQEHTKTVLK